MEILFLFFMCVGGCWLIAKMVGNIFFPDKKDKYTFVDKSVHHHHHEHKHVHIIDEKSKKDIAEYHEQKKLNN